MNEEEIIAGIEHLTKGFEHIVTEVGKEAGKRAFDKLVQEAKQHIEHIPHACIGPAVQAKLLALKTAMAAATLPGWAIPAALTAALGTLIMLQPPREWNGYITDFDPRENIF